MSHGDNPPSVHMWLTPARTVARFIFKVSLYVMELIFLQAVTFTLHHRGRDAIGGTFSSSSHTLFVYSDFLQSSSQQPEVCQWQQVTVQTQLSTV